MTSSLTWFELAEFDDFLSASLIDPLFYWSEIRKAYKHTNLPPDEILSTDESLKLIRNYLIFPVGKVSTLPPAKRLNYLIEEFLSLEKVRNFLRRYPYNIMIKEFIRHAKRYFSIYQKDCGFDICATDRYIQRSNKLEACVIARKTYNENDEIKYLYGCLSELSEEELDSLDQNDFSVINISSRGNSCLMLGPTRFINHDCNGNAKFWSTRNGMTIRATRKILIGEEITVPYSPDYFGKRNKDCLCATCERDLLGSYSVDPDVDLSKDLIIPPLEDEYSETEVIVIGSSDETGSKNQSDVEEMPLKDIKETKTPTPSSDSPIVQDSLSEITKVEAVKKKRKMTPASIDDDTANKSRKLRPRRKKKTNSSISTIKSFPFDNSPDSLRSLMVKAYGVGSKKLRCKELKQRKILRTFQRLYNTRYFDRDYQSSHSIYDCYNCGCYFEFNEKEFKSKHYDISLPEALEICNLPIKGQIDYLYCSKCLRHYQMYRLAWPFTEAQISNKIDLEILRQFLIFWPDDRNRVELIETPRYPYLKNKENDITSASINSMEKGIRNTKRFNYYDLNNYITQNSYESKHKGSDYIECISYTIPEIEQIFDDMKDMSFCFRQHAANEMKSRDNIDIPLRNSQLPIYVLEKLVQEWTRVFEVYIHLTAINQINASHSKESSVVERSKSTTPVSRLRAHSASESSIVAKKIKSRDLKDNSKKNNETVSYKESSSKKPSTIKIEKVDTKMEIPLRKNQNNSMQLSMLDLFQQRKKWQMNTHFMHKEKTPFWDHESAAAKFHSASDVSLSPKRQSLDKASSKVSLYRRDLNRSVTTSFFPSKKEILSKVDVKSMGDVHTTVFPKSEPMSHIDSNSFQCHPSKIRIPLLEEDSSDSSSGSDVEILGVVSLNQQSKPNITINNTNDVFKSHLQTSMMHNSISIAKNPFTTGIHSIDDSDTSSSDDDIMFYDNYPGANACV